MTKTIKWHLETGMQGAEWSGEITFPNVATEEEIDEAVREEVHNIISWTWWVENPDQTALTPAECGEPADTPDRNG